MMSSTEMFARSIFVDADVLSSPLTRTVLLVAAPLGEPDCFHPVWTHEVETEADRHRRPDQVPIAGVREQRWGDEFIVPDASSEDVAALVDTNPKDRHVLAAAHAAGASVVVTRNVRHFGRGDLARLRMDAAHPDAFLAAVLTPRVYLEALQVIAQSRHRAPDTPEALHAALGRDHPRLFAAMQALFPHVVPIASVHDLPHEVFRGDRCLVCGAMLTDPEALESGVGPQCRDKGGQGNQEVTKTAS